MNWSIRRSPLICRTVPLLAVLCLFGCEQALPPGPPEIRFGHDECIHCGMIISDARFAAASIITRDGKRTALLFDDLGDMIDFHRLNPAEPPVEQYVADYSTRRWISFTDAHFVHAPETHTPMGSGLLAFADANSAQSAAATHRGTTLSAASILRLREAKPSDSDPCCTQKASK